MDRTGPTELPPSSSRCDGIAPQHGDLLQIILDSLTHPFYVIDVADHRVRLANLAARQAHTSGAATCYALTHGRDSPCDTQDHPCPVSIIKQTGQPTVVEHVHYDEHGDPRNVEVHGFPMFDDAGHVTHVIEYCVDVTEHRRMLEERQWDSAVNKALAELADALIDPSFDIEEVAKTVLEQARRLTGSEHGYVSSIDPETGVNIGHTLTQMMGDQCRLRGKDRRTSFLPRPDGTYGALFGHALNTGQGFYTDAPAQHPAATGLPKGHIPLRNFLTVPAVVGSTVVGQIALANSDRGYSDRDLDAITRMAKLYALAIQRMHRQMALKASEERYALAQEAANIGSWDWNIVTGTLVWSERIEPMFGFARGRFAGTYEAFLQSVHPDDREFVIRSVNACVESNADYMIEHRIVWPDGAVRWVSERGDVVRDADGKAVRMLGVVQDITQRKEVELQVRDLAKFPAENPFPVLRVRSDGVVVYSNRPGRALMREWRTQPGHTLPDDWGRRVAEVFRRKVSHIAEVKAEGRVFSLALVPVENANYVNVYGRDVTEQKKAEREIRELNEDLERRVVARTTELTQANRQLQEEISRRRRLEKEILEISEKEQRRIGRELHDSLGQQLTGIAIISKVLEQKLKRQSLPEAANAKEIAQLVNEAVSETRQLSRGLHPVSLDADGLMTALQTLAATTQNLFSIPCQFQCRQPVMVKDPSAAVHLYRIAQEAVTNAARHGGAKQIWLELSAVGDADAVLVIENDGRDFPSKLPKSKGIGLQVMSYRAEMIGGALDVRARPGGGTKVTCTFRMDSTTDQKEKPHGLEDTP